MTRLGSNWGELVGLFLLLRGLGSSSERPSSSPSPGPAPSGTGTKVERVHTGLELLAAWVRRRLALALPVLRELDVPEDRLDRVALSIVSQWAHETNRGKSEFNFNLGGWRARKRDDFFTARDRLTGDEVFRWTAYDSLPAAVDDQIRRLHSGFPSAWRLLVSDPESSAWITQLGRKGYYTADPAAYARAWAMQRTELARIP